MSRRKDKERAEKGGPFRNTAERSKPMEDTKEEAYECFLCGGKITLETAERLTRYAKNKPQFIVNKEMSTLTKLLGGRDPYKSRVCPKCYREKVEG